MCAPGLIPEHKTLFFDFWTFVGDEIGLEGVFQDVFPIEDSHKNYILEYKNYYLGKPKYNSDECMDRGVTFSAPLRVRLALHITDENNKNEYAQSIEQDVDGNVMQECWRTNSCHQSLHLEAWWMIHQAPTMPIKPI